jgi:iron complex transport system substrate-binding protein
MLHKRIPVVLSLLLALLLTACGAPTAAPAATQAPPPAAAEPTQAAAPTEAPAAATVSSGVTITLTDSLGREVVLNAVPQRIVSLAPSNTEILFAIGAGGQLVGRDDFSDYPPEAQSVPSIGSLYPQVNAEAIVALQPDLVLAAGITNPDDVTALANLGLTVFSTRTATTLEAIYADIQDVGLLTGRAAQAGALVADLEARVAAIQAETSAVTERPRVFYEIDASEDASTPWTAGPGSLHEQLIDIAGGVNVGSVGSEDYFQISLEELVAQDPEIIVLGSWTFGGQTPELVAARAGWNDISAVKNGRMYIFDDNLVSRPGPRVVDGLEELARLIHPELFQ